ncbi:arylsulfatase [Aureibaculum algae]|uniref:Arylsulfatase n=1 Tax=Aureibaculum algae TaxID=2584122 RepID=A0A5B7TLY1_9FLAO|nr:arylsulfatase [Aureibaculum algae]QCX37415.1 arylsulfatase [Aureibaculum algae]
MVGKVLIFISLLFLASCKKNEVETTKQRPNIILIMSDDMGYSDISPFGGEIDTPNLTKLADEGLKFTQFYNTGRCCPTRASLLTGCYPQEAGVGHMTNPPSNAVGHNYGVLEYQGYLSKNTVTIAEVLKASGYTTMMAGKWHLGYENIDQWPMQRGFDNFYGIVPGAANLFKPVHPRGIVSGNEKIEITDPDFYTTDVFTDNAIQFINQSKNKSADKPFFLYLAYNAPHWPIQAPQEVVDKYKGKYKEGWQKLRLERYERMKKMGIINSDWQLTPQDSRDWDSLDEDKKKEMDLRMAIYAAMVDRMDQNIGRLVDSLKTNNLFDNTIIMFLNDNGACAEFSELADGPAAQLETKEGYILTYGSAWANASNTPYREYKHWLHEGGIATPFIIHWPNGIEAKMNGKIINGYGFLPDIMATVLDVSNADYPLNFNNNAIVPMSGKSLVPLWNNAEKQIHSEPIFWEHEGNKAVRMGKYKLVQKWEKDQNNWELYNMDNDRTEMHNLIQEMPEKATEMIGYYDSWATRIKVLPWNEVLSIIEEKNNQHN